MVHETAIIGRNVVIGKNAEIQPFVIIGDDVIIGNNCVIRSHTVIYKNNIIGKNFKTGHSVVIRDNNKIGNNVSIGSGTKIEYNVIIFHNVKIHSNCFIPEYTRIYSNVWIGPGCVFTNAKYPRSKNVKELLHGPTIFRNVIISANVTILPGVSIKGDTLIGAGSVVVKNTDDSSVYVGNPAKKTKSIKELKEYG